MDCTENETNDNENAENSKKYIEEFKQRITELPSVHKPAGTSSDSKYVLFFTIILLFNYKLFNSPPTPRKKINHVYNRTDFLFRL